MKNIIFSLVVGFLLLIGCKPQERVVYVNRDIIITRDSIVERVIKDTLFAYPPQSNQVIARDSSFLKTDLAFSFAKIHLDGVLFHSIENFGIIPGKIITEKTKVEDKEEKTIKETKYIDRRVEVIKHKKDWIWWVGLFSLIFTTIFATFKIKRIFVK